MALAGAVAAMMGAHLLWSLRPALVRVDQDFGNAYVAARHVLEGRSLAQAYERDSFLAEAQRWPELGLPTLVPHPPANALLLTPWAWLEPRAAKCVFTLILVGALVVSFVALRELTALPSLLLALVFLLPTAALANGLAYGQPYALLLACFAVSLLALQRGRPFVAGVLLAPAVVLKLYGLPFLAYFLWTRRWRAAAGLAVATGGLLTLSLAELGVEVHLVFLREVLPWALRGEIQDPYSPFWGSVTSLAYRLFRFEPDLNPSPVADAPGLAAALAGGVPLMLLLLPILASRHGSGPDTVRREWAGVALGSLAASPLTASYHFILALLPVALMVDLEKRKSAASHVHRLLPLLALLAFVTSSAPHYAHRWAHGWSNLFAYARLWALILLLTWAVWPFVTKARAAGAVALGVVAAGMAWSRPVPEDWSRVEGAGGYLAARPTVCGADVGWLAASGVRLFVASAAGARLFGPNPEVSPACVEGRLAAAPARPLPDVDALGGLVVEADRAGRVLRLRVPGDTGRTVAHGRFRHPRLAPDGRRVVVESWEEGSWDLRVFNLSTSASDPVAGGPANETEPAWSVDGRAILFASDRGRGLGSTMIYRVPFLAEPRLADPIPTASRSLPRSRP